MNNVRKTTKKEGSYTLYFNWSFFYYCFLLLYLFIFFFITIAYSYIMWILKKRDYQFALVSLVYSWRRRCCVLFSYSNQYTLHFTIYARNARTKERESKNAAPRQTLVCFTTNFTALVKEISCFQAMRYANFITHTPLHREVVCEQDLLYTTVLYTVCNTWKKKLLKERKKKKGWRRVCVTHWHGVRGCARIPYIDFRSIDCK